MLFFNFLHFLSFKYVVFPFWNLTYHLQNAIMLEHCVASTLRIGKTEEVEEEVTECFETFDFAN